jgi:hypothetical protein
MSKNPARIMTSAVFVLVAIVLDLAGARPASAQSWPPLTPEEKAMTDCAQQPGAPAVILYREELTDVESRTTTVFRRLKILTPAGRNRSNIEIPFVTGYTKVTGIEARVVPPQGPDREFSGQIFEKTIVRFGKLRMAVKTFALPDVDVGSIIDYRYKLEYGKSSSPAKALDEIMTGLLGREDRPEEGGVTEAKEWRAHAIGSWQVQEDLFTKRVKFSFTNNRSLINLILSGAWRVAWASVGIKEGTPRIGLGKAELEMSNIPAFQSEEFMIPEEMLRMSVDLFYLNSAITDGQAFWKLESTDWQKSVEKFIGKPGKLAATVRGIIGDATEPLEQLKRIYAKAQDVRNLSYEKDLTRAQRKEQKIRDNGKAADVLERGFGLRSDITRTFVALARAAGFTAEVVRVTARDNKLFRKDYLSFYDQLDSEAAVVHVGDRTMVFDPATPFCPFGLIHWSRTNSTALRFSDNPPAFFTTPMQPPEMALTQREIAVGLDLQGNLAGTVKTTYRGQEALVRRLEYLHDDDTTRTAALEKELTDVLPMGASATLAKIENFDNNDPALIADYAISVPGFAAAAGDKMLMPVSPLLGAARYPFRTTERKYPIYFPYPFREFDDIVITLPEGLTSEVRPASRKDQNEFSAYTLVCADEGQGKIHVQRDFVIKKSFFPVEQYKAVKALFDSARSSDEAQVIFTAVKK